jgi:hypothetical protein
MYNVSSALIIIAIIILALALIAAIIAYKQIGANGVISNNSASDISYIRGVLIFFIVIDSLLLLVAMYGLAKIRTSSMGGIFLFILGLIIAIVVLILGISAINKVDSVSFPWVLRGLVVNTVFIIIAFLFLVLSVFTKPRVCSGSNIKKIYEKMKFKSSDCMPECPPVNCAPIVNCPPPPQINCAPPVQQVNCAPMPQQIQCPPPVQMQQPICSPLPTNNNCGGLNYTGANGQIANYVQNPYKAVQ